jgi:hypothetical protein
MKIWLAIVCTACLSSSSVFAQSAASQIPPPPVRTDPSGIESVLVTGEQPGPSLWEVTDGEHSLWILASYAPLPKDMAWRSKEVESIIADSQEVLGAYQASFSISGPDTLRTKTSRLRKVLPRKAYSRWQRLRKQYIPRDIETERLLPVSAAMLLRVSALERSGLVYTDDLWRTIYTLANRHKVPVNTRHQLTIPITEPTAASGAKQRRVGVEYLVETMDRLEEDLLAARERANAWAVGDIDRMREQAKSDGAYAFLNAQSWPFLQGKQLQETMALADRKWVDAADAALKNNTTTFAVLPSYLIFQESGPLAALAARGYVIREPYAEP